jgi:hypothetical protein
MIGLIGGAYVYSHKELKTRTSNCLELQSGIVRMKLQYPEVLKNLSSDLGLRFKKTTDSHDADYIFVAEVQLSFYESLEDLIWHEQGGTNYSTSTLNTLEAGEYQHKEGNIEWNDYIIPIGNRVIHLGYQYTDLTSGDRFAVEKMIKNIRISTSTEDIKDTRVVDCPD